MDAIKQRFLADRVMTATPAQRVVMLYDRLALDLARARTDADGAQEHLNHAALIVGELLGSLDQSAGGPAENLASLYDYMLRQIWSAQLSGDVVGLTSVEANVWTLREAWTTIAAGGAEAASASPALAIGARWTA